MSSDTNREYIYLNVEYFDFENSENWEEYNGTFLCDLCFENKSNYVTFQCCGFEGGRIGGGGGGDIYVYYCNDCKNKRKRKHIKKYNKKALDNSKILLKKLSLNEQQEPYVYPIDEGMVEMCFNNFICIVKEDTISLADKKYYWEENTVINQDNDKRVFEWNDIDNCVDYIKINFLKV